jgi:hypothetical protein
MEQGTTASQMGKTWTKPGPNLDQTWTGALFFYFVRPDALVQAVQVVVL